MINHRVEIFRLQLFFPEEIGVESENQVTVLDWLIITEQKLLSITSGRIFHDDGGPLQPVQDKFRCHPCLALKHSESGAITNEAVRCLPGTMESIDQFLGSEDVHSCLLKLPSCGKS